MNHLVKFAMSIYSREQWRHYSVVTSSTRIVWLSHFATVFQTNHFLSDVQVRTVRHRQGKVTYVPFFLVIWWRNTSSTLWKPMHSNMETVFLGVRLQTVDTCSSTKKMILNDLNAWNVVKSTAWTVEWNGTKIWLASSTKLVPPLVKMMRNSWPLWKGRNLSNALNANFGYKKTRAVITWPVNVNLSFATNVEESIWNVTVSNRHASKWKIVVEWLNKKESRKLKERSKLRQGLKKSKQKNRGAKSKGADRKSSVLVLADVVDVFIHEFIPMAMLIWCYHICNRSGGYQSITSGKCLHCEASSSVDSKLLTSWCSISLRRDFQSSRNLLLKINQTSKAMYYPWKYQMVVGLLLLFTRIFLPTQATIYHILSSPTQLSTFLPLLAVSSVLTRKLVYVA